MSIQIDPQQDYTITLTGLEIMTIQNALLEIPAKFSNPLIQKIASQFNQVPDFPIEPEPIGAERVNI